MRVEEYSPFYSWLRLFNIGALLVLIDQYTKYVALMWCSTPVIINSFVSCETSFNHGASFSLGAPFFSKHPQIFIAILSILILLFIVMMIHKKSKNQSVLPEVFILAGAVSNLLDRINHGAVVDFIELSWGTFLWPAFNVADIFIVAGTGILIFSWQEK